MARRELTPLEVKAAQRLKALFVAKKKTLGITQETAAVSLGWSGSPVVNQYLNGKIPLNLEAGLKFCKLLQVEPSAINPAWAEHDSSEIAHLTPLQRDIYDEIKLMREDQLQLLDQLLKQMKK